MRNVTSPAFWESFERRQQEPVDAVPTHLPHLNRLCRDDGGGVGFARGWFITAAGNPGFGKSALALNLASAALKHGEPVGYISLEMTAGQIAARFYAIHSGVEIRHLERGGFDSNAFEQAKANMQNLPDLHVPDGIMGDWEDVVAFVHECHEKGARWFVLDYLQLVQTGADENINRAITEITTDLRAWAANEGTTVVALSQFNRVTSAEYKLRPRAQGMWGGMMLEASSDLVLLLDHSRYARDGHIARTFLIVDKNRHGPVAEIPVLWDYRTLRMREAQPDETDEWPE